MKSLIWKEKGYIATGEADLRANVFKTKIHELATFSDIEKESSRPAVQFTLDAKGRWLSLPLDTWLRRTTWSCEDNRTLSRDSACIGTHHTPIKFCAWQMVIALPAVKGFKLAHFVCHNDG